MIEQTVGEFRRRIEFTGAFDKRSRDPSKNYGIHGMQLRFVLIGPNGATQFVVYTGMQLPHVREELFAKQKSSPQEYDTGAPMGADIGYHSPVPQYDGQSAMKCDLLPGACYYDGSSLQAEEFMPTFLAGGDGAVWAMLEERYRHLKLSKPAATMENKVSETCDDNDPLFDDLIERRYY